jgi:hypothetical protein
MTGDNAVKEGRDARIEPLRSAVVPSGGGARARGELVLLPQSDELPEPPRHSTSPDPAREDADRVVAESRRYRLAVMRQARRHRLKGSAGGTS